MTPSALTGLVGRAAATGMMASTSGRPGPEVGASSTTGLYAPGPGARLKALVSGLRHREGVTPAMTGMIFGFSPDMAELAMIEGGLLALASVAAVGMIGLGMAVMNFVHYDGVEVPIIRPRPGERLIIIPLASSEEPATAFTIEKRDNTWFLKPGVEAVSIDDVFLSTRKKYELESHARIQIGSSHYLWMEAEPVTDPEQSLETHRVDLEKRLSSIKRPEVNDSPERNLILERGVELVCRFAKLALRYKRLGLAGYGIALERLEVAINAFDRLNFDSVYTTLFTKILNGVCEWPPDVYRSDPMLASIDELLDELSYHWPDPLASKKLSAWLAGSQHRAITPVPADGTGPTIGGGVHLLR